MTPKILPSELNSEERALVDFHVNRYKGTWQDHDNYAEALAEMEQTILARRQFFAPPVEASGKVCPNCGRPVKELHDHNVYMKNAYVCEKAAPAQPEPETATELAMRRACRDTFGYCWCGFHLASHGADPESEEMRKSWRAVNQPNAEPAPQPAKRDGELPEAVTNALRELRANAEFFRIQTMPLSGMEIAAKADALESWARSLPKATEEGVE